MPLPAPSPMLILFQAIAAAAAGHPGGAGVARQDALCLARNIYFEARGEGREGQEAVASVTLNRVRSAVWPASVCEVVYQPLQFSWTAAHPRGTVPPVGEAGAWREVSEVAARALLGQVRDRTGGATHYVAPARVASMPGWVGAMVPTQRIGGHRFLAAAAAGVPARPAFPVPAAKPRGAILLAEIMSRPPPAMPVRARTSRFPGRFLDGGIRLPPSLAALLPVAWTGGPPDGGLDGGGPDGGGLDGGEGGPPPTGHPAVPVRT